MTIEIKTNSSIFNLLKRCKMAYRSREDMSLATIQFLTLSNKGLHRFIQYVDNKYKASNDYLIKSIIEVFNDYMKAGCSLDMNKWYVKEYMAVVFLYALYKQELQKDKEDKEDKEDKKSITTIGSFNVARREKLFLFTYDE